MQNAPSYLICICNVFSVMICFKEFVIILNIYLLPFILRKRLFKIVFNQVYKSLGNNGLLYVKFILIVKTNKQKNGVIFDV